MEKFFLNFLKKQDQVNLAFFLSSVIFIFFALIFILINFSRLPSKIPLFYSLAWGEGQLATTVQIFILPLIATLILLINLVISWHLHKTQTILKRIVGLSSAMISFMILLTCIKIILIFV